MGCVRFANFGDSLTLVSLLHLNPVNSGGIPVGVTVLVSVVFVLVQCCRIALECGVDSGDRIVVWSMSGVEHGVELSVAACG